MKKLIEAFNNLGIEDMPEVTKLYGHKGEFVNIECKLPNGKIDKILDNNKMYYTAELQKLNSERCYGLVTDKVQLAVYEYSNDGNDAQLIVWKKI